MNYSYDVLKLDDMEIVNRNSKPNYTGFQQARDCSRGNISWGKLIQTYTEQRTSTVHYAESYEDGFDKPVKYGNLGELKRC